MATILTNGITMPDGNNYDIPVFVAVFDQTPIEDIFTAIHEGKTVYCNYEGLPIQLDYYEDWDEYFVTFTSLFYDGYSTRIIVSKERNINGPTTWRAEHTSLKTSYLINDSGFITLEDIPDDGKLPAGGSIGNLLMKRSNADYDTEWIAPATSVQADNTLPITSGAVYTEIGNINALLATI